MKAVWIADSGPVIVLAKAGYLHLLEDPLREVWLPGPVVREIGRGKPGDPARQAVQAGWGTQVRVSYIPVAVRRVGLLDRGEQSVLALAVKMPGSMAVLDDMRGRKAADALGAKKIGTLAVVVAARRQGRIPAVGPVFHELRRVGHYFDDVWPQEWLRPWERSGLELADQRAGPSVLHDDSP